MTSGHHHLPLLACVGLSDETWQDHQRVAWLEITHFAQFAVIVPVNSKREVGVKIESYSQTKEQDIKITLK